MLNQPSCLPSLSERMLGRGSVHSLLRSEAMSYEVILKADFKGNAESEAMKSTLLA